MKGQFTPAPWVPIEFGGFWNIMDSDFYEANNILNQDECARAEVNAHIAAAAPELLATSKFFVKKVQDIIEICQRYLEPGNYNQADALSDILESIDNAEIALKLQEGESAIKKANP